MRLRKTQAVLCSLAGAASMLTLVTPAADAATTFEQYACTNPVVRGSQVGYCKANSTVVDIIWNSGKRETLVIGTAGPAGQPGAGYVYHTIKDWRAADYRPWSVLKNGWGRGGVQFAPKRDAGWFVASVQPYDNNPQARWWCLDNNGAEWFTWYEAKGPNPAQC